MSRRKRIVYVVDNDDAVRDSLKSLLEAAGFQAHLFASGEAFLDSADTLAEGCVILDIRLPKRDGFEVLQALAEKRSELPVVMITAHAHLAEQARKTGIDAIAILDKPVSDDKLLPIIEGVLSTGEPELSHFERRGCQSGESPARRSHT